MEIIEYIALFLHLVGFAVLFGFTIGQLRADAYVVKSGMLHGALLQLLSGLVLVGIKGTHINHIAAGVKLFILIAILGTLFFYERKEGKILPKGQFFAVLSLTLLEVLVAILWIEADVQ
jgi:hypothetical protein